MALNDTILNSYSPAPVNYYPSPEYSVSMQRMLAANSPQLWRNSPVWRTAGPSPSFSIYSPGSSASPRIHTPFYGNRPKSYGGTPSYGYPQCVPSPLSSSVLSATQMSSATPTSCGIASSRENMVLMSRDHQRETQTPFHIPQSQQDALKPRPSTINEEEVGATQYPIQQDHLQKMKQALLAQNPQLGTLMGNSSTANSMYWMLKSSGFGIRRETLGHQIQLKRANRTKKSSFAFNLAGLRFRNIKWSWQSWNGRQHCCMVAQTTLGRSSRT